MGLPAPTRRDVLRGMVAGGAALASGCSNEVIPPVARPRVAIVGAGMAGVATAWLLDGAWDVVLLEARPEVGGNVRAHEMTIAGQVVHIDLGAQYFAPGPYPTYVGLLDTLELTDDEYDFPASSTVLGAGEDLPRFVSPIVPDRLWPTTESWNNPGVTTFAVLASDGSALEREDRPYSTTLDAWLRSLSLDEYQREQLALPWAASLFSGGIEQARGFSARAAMSFLSLATAGSPFAPVRYRTMIPGLGEALRRMLAACTTVTVRTRTPVTGLTRRGTGFTVQTGDTTEDFDALVLALPAERAVPLVSGLTGMAPMTSALAGIGFHDAVLMLHSDPVYAAADPRYWSFVNATVSGDYCENSMWLAAALAPLAGGAPVELWKSWVTHRARPPADVLHEVVYRHALPTPVTVASGAALREMNGTGGVWLAGGWLHPYDSQETALRSALEVAAALAPASPRAAGLGAPTGSG